MAKKKAKSKTAEIEVKQQPGAMPVSDDSWKHEDDARQLERAAEVMADPERLKNAHKFHKKKKKAMRSVDDLIKHRNSTYGGAKAPSLEVEYEDED